MSTKESADKIRDAVSMFNSHSVSELAEALANEHPTLQQNVMRFAIEFIAEMATKQGNDLRNIESVKLARKIRNYVFEEHDGKFYTPPLPFI